MRYRKDGYLLLRREHDGAEENRGTGRRQFERDRFSSDGIGGNRPPLWQRVRRINSHFCVRWGSELQLQAVTRRGESERTWFQNIIRFVDFSPHDNLPVIIDRGRRDKCVGLR